MTCSKNRIKWEQLQMWPTPKHFSLLLLCLSYVTGRQTPVFKPCWSFAGLTELNKKSQLWFCLFSSCFLPCSWSLSLSLPETKGKSWRDKGSRAALHLVVLGAYFATCRAWWLLCWPSNNSSMFCCYSIHFSRVVFHFQFWVIIWKICVPSSVDLISSSRTFPAFYQTQPILWPQALQRR